MRRSLQRQRIRLLSDGAAGIIIDVVVVDNGRVEAPSFSVRSFLLVLSVEVPS